MMDLDSKANLQFFVNGDFIVDREINPEQFLANYIREKLGLTGTKIACGVGGCGSCTVVLSKYNKESKEFTHSAINACITPLWTLQGCHILTVEGLAKPKSCHVIQDAIARGNGTQCGFCTPGIVMSMVGLSQCKDKPTTHEIKTALQGNLCRCTGYRPILEAFQNCKFTNCDEESKKAMDIEDIIPQIECPREVNSKAAVSFKRIENLLDKFHNSAAPSSGRKLFQKSSSTWIMPATMEQLLEDLTNNSEAKLVAGFTDIHLNNDQNDINTIKTFISIGSIPELKNIEKAETGICFGSMVTISEMLNSLEKHKNVIPNYESQIFAAILKLMEYYGSNQIRNSATIGGSLLTANPASDIQTIFLGFGLTAEIMDKSTKRTMTQNIPSPEDSILVLNINTPCTSQFEFAWTYKITKRKYNDSAILNIAILTRLEEDLHTVNNISFAVGGKAVKRFYLKNVIPEKSKSNLLNVGFTEFFMNLLLQNLENNLTNKEYPSNYIKQLGKSLSLKFYNWLRKETAGKNKPSLVKEISLKSTQLFAVKENSGPYDLVGQPQPHASAYKHATGEAQYLDDIPKYTNELTLALVLSSRPHAYIKSINFTEAANLDGVVGFVTHNDLPTKEHNMFGVIVEDEEVFASKKVTCVGQIIAGIVAKCAEIAQKAVKLVHVEYEDIQPYILTIPDAIRYDSYFQDFSMKLEKGSCPTVFKIADHKLSGNITVDGQEHFYLEPQGCLAIPNGEDGEMTIVASTQYPTKVQLQVADRLGVPANRITVKVKRIGGGFGGKECRCLLAALPSAIAAQKFGKPVRLILNRETDMLISGKRHPFEANYTIAFTNEGRILGLECKLYCNGGCSLDASPAAIERALLNIDNAYLLPNVKLEGYICKTNLPSNTVFRGTGAPQVVFIIENIIEKVAKYLNKDSIEVRNLNLYRDGDLTPYEQKIENSTIRRCWEECLKQSSYKEQKHEIENFNRLSLWKKRGIAITPAQYGVGYTALALNQSSALVHVYKDGSVALNHGGVEIGQGLHTKMIQIASRELGIPSSKIRTLETSTDKVPNAPPTAASCSSDLNGMAVVDACQQIKKRLKKYFNEDPLITWEDAILKAFEDRVDLAATGFYKTPIIGWKDVRKMKGSPFNYFSSSSACSTVEVDCLTGRFQILKTDIVMDVGLSINQAIDIGQIEGAFLQGVGLYTMEELIYNDQGKLETTNPNTYKIPSIGDTPLEFNVTLLADSPNTKAVYSSKAVGEPPLLLAPSVFLAIKDAIEDFRKSSGHSTKFELNSPATAEKILMACSYEDDDGNETVIKLSKML